MGRISYLDSRLGKVMAYFKLFIIAVLIVLNDVIKLAYQAYISSFTMSTLCCRIRTTTPFMYLRVYVFDLDPTSTSSPESLRPRDRPLRS
jgi:hypothetical protein